jgi:uncharacterized protein (DUF362 family)
LKRVFIAKIDGRPLQEKLLEALNGVGWEEYVPLGARVFVKPNLTWRAHRPGVTASPELLEALVALLCTRTSHVIVGESDGGYHSFAAEESFQGHGLYALAEKYPIQVVNLSKLPAERARARIGRRDVEVELPSQLLHEVDAFITVPVPKVHAMTRVSLAFKNQWGCIPSPMRLRNHSGFKEKILAINTLLKPRLAVYDGRYFLDKSGPMVGEPVPLDLLIAANDIGAGDWACCQIMGVDPERVPHLRAARRAGMFPSHRSEIAFNQDPAELRTRRFSLQRTPLNYIALMGFQSSLLTKLLYDSAVGRFLHRVLYAVRRHPLVARFLYGRFGPLRREV